MDSYKEEKQGLIDHEVYEKISKNQYLDLRRAGRIPKAIPSMCVLVVENNKDGKPLRAKSQIVVLGNFEDLLYQKLQRYAPVLNIDPCVSWQLIQREINKYYNKVTVRTRSIMPPFHIMRSQQYDLQLETRFSKKMNTSSWRERFMAYVDPHTIGTIWSKGFCLRWASRPLHMILASFLI